MIIAEILLARNFGLMDHACPKVQLGTSEHRPASPSIDCSIQVLGTQVSRAVNEDLSGKKTHVHVHHSGHSAVCPIPVT